MAADGDREKSRPTRGSRDGTVSIPCKSRVDRS